jgi:hypothetical protein
MHGKIGRQLLYSKEINKDVSQGQRNKTNNSK